MFITIQTTTRGDADERVTVNRKIRVDAITSMAFTSGKTDVAIHVQEGATGKIYTAEFKSFEERDAFGALFTEIGA